SQSLGRISGPRSITCQRGCSSSALAGAPGSSRRSVVRKSTVSSSESNESPPTRAAPPREAAESAGALYAPEALHAVRIAAKKLRYALEVARAVRVAGAASAARRLRQYQDLLGVVHGLQIVSAHASRPSARR